MFLKLVYVQLSTQVTVKLVHCYFIDAQVNLLFLLLVFLLMAMMLRKIGSQITKYNTNSYIN